MGRSLLLTERPSFLRAQVMEELKTSSCSQVLEKYDSFSTKVSLETPRFLWPTPHPVMPPRKPQQDHLPTSQLEK